MADRQATAANDPLHARCLVLDDGRTKLAVVVVDSCMIPRDLMDAAKAVAEKATGIPASNMLVSATHTHSAPAVAGVFQTDPDAGYAQYLAARIAEGIEKAHANLAPAKVGWASVPEPAHLFNRRWRMRPDVVSKNPFGGTDAVKMNPGLRNPGLLEPAGPIDPDVAVLSVQAADGRPLALLANYGLHYVGGFPPLSADYFGVFSERVGSAIGADAAEPRFVGMMSNGTSGDVNNVNFREPASKRPAGDQARLVAESVAQAAKKACGKAVYRADVTLAAAEKEVELRVRKPTADDVAKARQALDAAKGRALKGVEEIYARETVLLAAYPDTVRLKLMALRVGDLGIAAIPCEVFTDIGLAIKRRSPLPATFTVSLANGYNGYLPTPAQHALGGYETWRARSSYLEERASDVVTATVLELLDAVAKR